MHRSFHESRRAELRQFWDAGRRARRRPSALSQSHMGWIKVLRRCAHWDWVERRYLPLPERASVWWASSGRPTFRSSDLVRDPRRPARCDTHRSPRCVQPWSLENSYSRRHGKVDAYFINHIEWLPNSPIVIHHHDGQADLLHVLRGNVEDDGLVVGGIQRAFLGCCLPLL